MISNTGRAVCVKRLLKNLNKRKLIKKNNRLINSIFIKGIQLIIEDIINNNIHFKFPSYNKKTAELFMDNISGEDFKNLYKKGYFRDIDWMISNFTSYYIKFQLSSQRKTYTYPVYLDKQYKQMLTKYINEGKQY